MFVDVWMYICKISANLWFSDFLVKPEPNLLVQCVAFRLCVQNQNGFILKRLWWLDCNFTLILLVDSPVPLLKQCEVDLRHSGWQPYWNINRCGRRVREISGSWKRKSLWVKWLLPIPFTSLSEVAVLLQINCEIVFERH